MQQCNNILIWSHKICISIIDAIRVAVLSDTDLSANTEGAGSLFFLFRLGRQLIRFFGIPDRKGTKSFICLLSPFFLSIREQGKENSLKKY